MLPPTKGQAGQKDTETGVRVLHLTGSPSVPRLGMKGGRWRCLSRKV